ncbi:stage II sporulation protein D [Anaerotignum sp.]|nr:stage II sporulation protein D [Anaerotignum sp.]MBQ7757693.1 stage II sporulation protein D [Anaerotignum sp.]
MKKLLSIVLFYIILAVLLLPFLVTLLCGGFAKELPQQAKALYGLADLAPLDSELEEYVVGVVAAEMPAAFPEEALKAQAVAARTYQIRQMQAAGSDFVLYDVGQAYITTEEQKKKWGENYAFYAGKIRNAVRATAGEIMVYNGEPILAAFHAQSAGKTEDAENVWNEAVPYLKSVNSMDDKNAPDNKTVVTFSAKEISNKLGCDLEEISILSRTEAGYVDEVQAGDKILTGREVREALALRSANFTIEKRENDIIFTVFGYGHGAGMSQYGASFLAEKGMDYHEILNHYYTDIQFEKIE